MKYYTTGKVASICGFKNSREVAKKIDNGEIKGKIIQGKDGRARKSYRIVARSSLIRYIEGNRLDIESAFSWLLSQKIDDFKRRLLLAKNEHGFIGENPGLIEGIMSVVSVLRPDTSEKFDPLSKIIFDKLSELTEYDMKLRRLKANTKH